MRVFSIGAGGFHTSGLMIVAAHTPERATELANEESAEKWGLTYHAHNANELHTITHNNTETTTVIEHVIVNREFGHPELPSGYDSNTWKGMNYHGQSED